MTSVTGFFAGILAFMFIGLSMLVIKQRRKTKTMIGDGGDEMLQRRICAQGNFAEYVPFVLLLMAVAELRGTPSGQLSLLGIALVMGRMSHAYGLLVAEMQPERQLRFRIFGMIITLGVLGLSALLAILASMK